MTDERLYALLQAIETRLDTLCREVAEIRQSVLPDLTEIIAMHAGRRTATEAEDDT